MTRWIARALFGLTPEEIHSLRSQNAHLLARLEVIVEERDEARRKLNEMQDEILGFSKHAIDGMLANNGQLPWFGVGPQPKEMPDFDWSKVSSGRAARVAERKNREFLKSHEIVPHNGGWTEPTEQAS